MTATPDKPFTREEFVANFPHATESAIRANCWDAVRRQPSKAAPRGPLPDPQPERDKAPALDRPAQGEVRSLQRTVVRFVGYRVRPLDPDNFAGSVKDLLDGLRHAALIRGDEPWRIVLETEQVKVAHYAEERTDIVIERPILTPGTAAGYAHATG